MRSDRCMGGHRRASAACVGRGPGAPCPAGGDPAGSPATRPGVRVRLSAAELDEAAMGRLVERLARLVRKWERNKGRGPAITAVRAFSTSRGVVRPVGV